MNYLIYLNGKTVPENEACISIRDRGFLYGDGLFETIRAYNGNAFRLDAHLDRLFTSAKEFKIHLNYTPIQLRSAVQNLLTLNKLTDAYIRITLSRGTPTNPKSQIPNPKKGFQPTLVIETKPLTPYPQEYYKHGISIIVSKTRISASWPLAAHKTLNFMNNILSREDANSKGAQEVLFLNTDGHVAECSVSNIFLVKNNEIITPSLTANILPGITRKTVLEVCKQNGIVAREELFNLERLIAADEVFLTNSLMEVMPVATIDKHSLSLPVPGRLTKRIMEAYRKATLIPSEVI
ncbi:MAG TPA: aminodeoxychorismate lyase [Candidatus Brocadiia bacterium]|nr:aminodeoxychorismate lyase [Candidatus Brocadiales bacterium]